MPSSPAALLLGLVFTTFLTSLSRMVGSEWSGWLKLYRDCVPCALTPGGLSRSLKYLFIIFSSSCKASPLVSLIIVAGLKGSSHTLIAFTLL